MSRKAKKGEFVSALGVVFEIIKKISDAIKSLGGNDEDLRRVLTEDGLAKKVAEVIMTSKQKACETYKVIVDYSLSLTEMIKAGKYDWFCDKITDKHFTIQGAGQHEVELVLVHLDRYAMTKEVLEYLKEQCLEPAKIEHLLAFGAAYRDVQREFLIVALGSAWVHVYGFIFCPSLHSYVGGHKLCLSGGGDDARWLRSRRFLAFRK